MIHPKSSLLIICLICFSCSPSNQREQGVEANIPINSARSPNVLLIVADDMGIADLGSFGGEIQTPNLDELAYQGVRLANFHVAPSCSPTRAMLLTGLDSHRVGLGNMAEEMASNQVGRPGYEGHINDVAPTISERLKALGYHTYLSGKWHLGITPESLPSARGFDKTFILGSGGASHYSDMKPAYAPSPEIKAPYFEKGERLTALPDDFKYSSQYYADKIIEFIDEDKQTGRPFFGLLAFTAPHWPLQAPSASVQKYAGEYDEGYEVLAKKRFAEQLELGILPPNASLNGLPEKLAPAWESLSEEQRRSSVKAMEIYAAMVHEMDAEVGRVISYLKQNNLFDNTLIIFMSDNGAEGHTLDETWPAEQFPKIRATIDGAHDFSYEAMGDPGSYVFYDAGWARAGAPGFRLHKGFPTEGGTRVPAFIRYSGVGRKGDVDSTQFHVKDIVPTILDFVTNPKHVPIVANLPIDKVVPTGLSMLPYLEKGTMQLAPRVEVFELFGKISVREYPWKLVFSPRPWGSDEWQLFNLETDLLESKDVALENQEIVARLKHHWDSYQAENGVILPSENSGY